MMGEKAMHREQVQRSLGTSECGVFTEPEIWLESKRQGLREAREAGMCQVKMWLSILNAMGKAESRMVVARDWGKHWEVTVKGYKVLVMQDEL